MACKANNGISHWAIYGIWANSDHPLIYIFIRCGICSNFRNINFMTTNEIARRLVELCRKGKFKKAQKELYADDAVSIEPYATPEFEKETKGLDALLKKGDKFTSMVEKYN